ncbi:unnamed protein product [Dicrocoelium dendriticum]|nr:unnamed protein product [Dicrocoelium dendriticum]
MDGTRSLYVIKPICDNRLWAYLPPKHVEKIRNAVNTTDIKEVLKEAGFSREVDLFSELLNQAILLSATEEFSTQQLTVFITILNELWELCAACPFASIQDAVKTASQLLLQHSVQHPPQMVEIFSIRQARQCMKFILSTLFRYWKLYKYNLTPAFNLLPRFIYDDEAKTPKSTPKSPAPSGKSILHKLLRSAAGEDFTTADNL